MKFSKKVKTTTKAFDFYAPDIWAQDFKGLKLGELVDNGTTHVNIPTPKGWKCKRKNCTTNFKHTHGTYPSLNAKR